MRSTRGSEEAQELRLQRNALQEENRRLKQENMKLNLHLEQEQETVALYHLLRDEQVLKRLVPCASRSMHRCGARDASSAACRHMYRACLTDSREHAHTLSLAHTTHAHA